MELIIVTSLFIYVFIYFFCEAKDSLKSELKKKQKKKAHTQLETTENEKKKKAKRTGIFKMCIQLLKVYLKLSRCKALNYLNSFFFLDRQAYKTTFFHGPAKEVLPWGNIPPERNGSIN